MSATPSRASALAEVVHDDRAVVLNLPRVTEQQSPYVFDGVAFEIWRRIDGTRSEEQIVAELAEAFGAPRERVAEDVAAFVAQLRELGLVH